MEKSDKNGLPELVEIINYLTQKRELKQAGIAQNIGMTPNNLTQIVKGYRYQKKIGEVITKIKIAYKDLLPSDLNYSESPKPVFLSENDKLSKIIEQNNEIKEILHELIKKIS